MYNVMIVEDSKPILRNIRTLLGSLELPVQVVATAANGEEALELIRQQPVDLVLTDIRMPKMDGLALIEQAKPLRPRLLFILISGYNDFEYTRKAINLQVFDYLLKPVERKQLAEVMDRALERLQSRIPSEAELFKEIVEPGFYEELQLGDQFRHYGKMLILIRRQPFAGGRERWSAEGVQQRLDVLFTPHLCWVFPTQMPGQFLALVQKTAVESYSSVYECLESIRCTLEKAGLSATVGGQQQAGDPDRLPEFYHRVSGILDERQRIHQGVVIDTEISPAPALGGSDNLDLDRATAAAFTELILGRRKEQFLLKLNEQLIKWAGENIRLAELERFVALLVDAFSQAGGDLGTGHRLELEASSRRLLEVDDFERFCQGLEEWAKQAFERVQAQNRKSGEELFRQIEEYVRVNLYSYLSIADVALKFHVSPSYISRVMKKYAQSTFVQYYTGLKIKEACRLIACKPEMRIKEVSDALSFSDQHYFSKVFKEYTGYSPSDYKERFPPNNSDSSS
ncbi:MAG: response regulator [Paenibacillus sp.]|uniref:response regulator transcription factor n=1 Tax=Paenibacillus sp. TaxID=58172 RepID=UPI00291403E2|nr:response regulator [Paenibacillus sp.]MDU4694861.1 response regulator [Paenibacillus sp.]